MEEEARRIAISRWRGRVDLLATVLVIATCGVMLWRAFAPGAAAPAARAAANTPLPSEPVDIQGAVLKGSDSAPLVMIEYSEFQCPFCGAFVRDTLPTLERDYIATGSLQLAFVHFPLEPMHPLAVGAAEAAECAGKQGKFWALHDSLFADPARLDGARIARSISTLDLDDEQFNECVAGNSEERIRAGVARARELGVNSTPTFFFGVRDAERRIRVKRRLAGARPISEFKALLDAMLKEL